MALASFACGRTKSNRAVSTRSGAAIAIGELPTSGGDVSASVLPNEGGDPSTGENLSKRLGSSLIRALVGQPRILVVGNQVHLGRNSPKQLRQPMGVLLRVIDAFHQHVLESDPPTLAKRHLAASLEERSDVSLAVDGHDRRSLLVGARVER